MVGFDSSLFDTSVRNFPSIHSNATSISIYINSISFLDHQVHSHAFMDSVCHRELCRAWTLSHTHHAYFGALQIVSNPQIYSRPLEHPMDPMFHSSINTQCT
eukprot:320376_1